MKSKALVVKVLPKERGKLTFKRICALEPEILDLLEKAQHVKRKKDAYTVLHRQIKPLLTMLVGANAKNPALRTFEAYEIAVDTIIKALGI